MDYLGLSWACIGLSWASPGYYLGCRRPYLGPLLDSWACLRLTWAALVFIHTFANYKRDIVNLRNWAPRDLEIKAKLLRCLWMFFFVAKRAVIREGYLRRGLHTAERRDANFLTLILKLRLAIRKTGGVFEVRFKGRLGTSYLPCNIVL